jgi:hypothetical protein
VTRPEAVEAPFRPRRARWVGYPLAAGLLLAAVVLSVAMTLLDDSAWTTFDTVSAVLFGFLVAVVLHRIAGVHAVPTREALVVHNVVHTVRVEWGAILAVRFGGADPWLTLDTDDGENVPVMAVQRADGEHGRAEAERLARLVERLAPRPPQDRAGR